VLNATASASTRAVVDAGAMDDAGFAALTAATSSVRGRVVYEDGAPAPDVALRLHGWPASDASVAEFGLPDDWSDPELAPTNADGRFEFAFDAPRAFQFTLDAERTGFAPVRWRFASLEPNEVVDVGEAVLARGCTLVVHLRNALGAPVFDGWSVSASVDRTGFDDAPSMREPYAARARYEEGLGGFVFEAASPGTVRLNASHRLGARLTDFVECELDARNEATLVYGGPDLARRIAVKLTGSLVARRFPPESGAVRLEAPGVPPRVVSATDARASGLYAFDDVPPGQYDVVLDDERFEPLTVPSVAPGELVSLPARGASGVRLQLVDGSGAPFAARYSLGVNWPEPGRNASDHMLHLPADEPPSGGVYGGLIPGRDMRLTLRVDGGAEELIEVAALTPGEVRDVTSIVDLSHVARGRVLAPDGVTPLAGVTVELTRGPRAGHHGRRGGTRRVGGEEMRRIERATTSDADGRFTFDALVGGAWTVHARWGELLYVDRTLELGASAAECELPQPLHGYLVGRVLAPASVDLAEFRVSAWPNAGEWVSYPESHGAPSGGLSSVGEFRAGPFPLGTRWLQLGDFSMSVGGVRTSTVMQLGAFDVHEGDSSPIDIDLRESFPGAVHVALRIDGEPASFAYVSIETLSPQGSDGAHGASLSASGEVRLAGLPPGAARAEIRDRDGTWNWRAPTPLSVPCADVLELELDLVTHERELLVLDAASAEPVADLPLKIVTDAWGGEFSASRSTDANGRLRLRMPELTARFASARSADDVLTPSTVPWGMGDSPIVLHVTLAH